VLDTSNLNSPNRQTHHCLAFVNNFDENVAATSDNQLVYMVFFSFTYVNIGSVAGGANLRFLKLRAYDGAILSVKGSNSGGDDRL
jgi:hypothetical protein